MSRIWFITGTSRGLGRVWAEAALDRGDRVVATARDVGSLAGLLDRYGDNVLGLELDVTDKGAVGAAVATAHDHFGGLDIVVNNAGYGLFGAVEEVSEEQARAQFETNVFGALWLTQAALPYLRERGSGHIVQTSSVGGVNAFPTLGIYHASKWALEGMTQSLAAEVAGQGIHVTLVEPVSYATDWFGGSAIQAEPLPAYDGVRAAVAEAWSGMTPRDPKATGPAILRVVDAEQPPLRVFFGTGSLELMRGEYEQRLATWEEWEDVAVLAAGAS